MGIGEAALLRLGLATPATSHAGVAFRAFPGDASGVSCWRRLGRYLYLGIDFDLGPGRRLMGRSVTRLGSDSHCAPDPLSTAHRTLGHSVDTTFSKFN